jgi:ABC-type phosphate transport system substrate-binding protein
VARYAILPVANNHSSFARTYGEKGLNRDLINQLFFYDIYADKDKQAEIKSPFTIYTRLQQAGVPTVFARYFGYEQKDIKGKSIAGADEHLLKAVLRDSTAVTYLPLTFIYDHTSGKPIDGLTVLPVDLNGNGKVNDDEKIVGDLSPVIQQLENASSKEKHNIPVEYLHFSIDKRTTNKDAVDFLRWVISNGEKDLHEFGYLTPEPSRVDKGKFEQFASQRTK